MGAKISIQESASHGNQCPHRCHCHRCCSRRRRRRDAAKHADDPLEKLIAALEYIQAEMEMRKRGGEAEGKGKGIGNGDEGRERKGKKKGRGRGDKTGMVEQSEDRDDRDSQGRELVQETNVESQPQQTQQQPLESQTSQAQEPPEHGYPPVAVAGPVPQVQQTRKQEVPSVRQRTGMDPLPPPPIRRPPVDELPAPLPVAAVDAGNLQTCNNLQAGHPSHDEPSPGPSAPSQGRTRRRRSSTQVTRIPDPNGIPDSTRVPAGSRHNALAQPPPTPPMAHGARLSAVSLHPTPTARPASRRSLHSTHQHENPATQRLPTHGSPLEFYRPQLQPRTPSQQTAQPDVPRPRPRTGAVPMFRNPPLPNPAGPRPRPQPPVSRRGIISNPTPVSAVISGHDPLNDPLQHIQLQRRLQDIRQQRHLEEILQGNVSDHAHSEFDRDGDAQVPVRELRRRGSEVYGGTPVTVPDNRNRVGERSVQRERDMSRRSEGQNGASRLGSVQGNEMRDGNGNGNGSDNGNRNVEGDPRWPLYLGRSSYPRGPGY